MTKNKMLFSNCSETTLAFDVTKIQDVHKVLRKLEALTGWTVCLRVYGWRHRIKKKGKFTEIGAYLPVDIKKVAIKITELPDEKSAELYAGTWAVKSVIKKDDEIEQKKNILTQAELQKVRNRFSKWLEKYNKMTIEANVVLADTDKDTFFPEFSNKMSLNLHYTIEHGLIIEENQPYEQVAVLSAIRTHFNANVIDDQSSVLSSWDDSLAEKGWAVIEDAICPNCKIRGNLYYLDGSKPYCVKCMPDDFRTKILIEKI